MSGIIEVHEVKGLYGVRICYVSNYGLDSFS